MNKKLLILLLVGLLAGCSDRSIQTVAAERKVVNIDGCEYLVFESGHPGYNSYALAVTHKGDCSSPIHSK